MKIGFLFAEILPTLIPAGLLLALASHGWAAEDATGSGGVRLQSLKTHSQLLIPLDEGTATEVKNTPEGFELRLKGASLDDLGATNGLEAVFKSQVSRMRDARLAGVEFAQAGSDVLVKGQWKYPSGAQAPAHPKVEIFEYRNRSPYPQYVLDFWHATGPTRVEELARLAREKAIAAQNAREKTWKERSERRIATQARRSEDEDTLRFCKLPLSTETDLFPRVGALHQAFDFSKYLPTTTPDAGYVYMEPNSPTAEAEGGKYVRLALSLYKKGDYALAARTVEFLETEVPRSKFLPEMKFLRANAQVRLGFDEAAERSLKGVMNESPGTPMAMFAAGYRAVKQLEKGQWLPASESFLGLQQTYLSSPSLWVFHLGMAEAFYHVRETDKAAKEYQWVIEKGPEASRAEAALRKGDLYMDRFYYDQALAAYFQGFEYFPEAAKSFASIWLNRSEALYGLGQFERAKAGFEEAIQKFPAHPELWRAHFRIGEILARAEYPKPSPEKSRASFLEAVNRYPFSAGATLARMRLIPCGDHAGFTPTSMERFFKEDAAKLLEREDIAGFGLKDFIRLSHVKARIGLGLESGAVDLATQEMTEGRSPEVHNLFAGLIGAVFRKHILGQLLEGKKAAAVEFYRQKAPLLPRSHVYVDPDYLLKLSQAASDLGLAELAQTLSDSFAHAEAARKAHERKLAGNEEQSGRDLSVVLADSEKSFTAAKALWQSGGQKSEQAEREIRDLLAKVKPESPFSFERELMLGLLEHSRGRVATAFGHASKAQLLGGVGDIRFEAWMALLTAKAGDAKLALAQLASLETKLPDSPEAEGRLPASAVAGLPALPSKLDVLYLQGDLQEKLGRWGAAAETYSRAVALATQSLSKESKDAKEVPTRATYAYARALLKEGGADSRARGLGALAKVAEAKTEDFWTKLARATLKTEKQSDSPANVSKEGNSK